ncbi:uncharacterized protein [Clytia hemisphaerica]|uniref:uncharacterized protein n=1 Tax=Clytia hemisphaerica TaxID=252671 RepID=UPI0034D3EE71|eukprot:TCONS_00061352-protein
MDLTIRILSVSSLVFNTICACAHCYCLALLYQSRRLTRFTNQRILIANISICEIIFCIAQIRINTYDLLKETSSQGYLIFERFIRFSALIVFYLALHHITMDRFMEVYYHLRYTVIATKSRIIRILLVYWVGSITAGIVLITATLTIEELTLDKTTEYVFYFSLFADFTVLINAAFTYTYLYRKFRKLNRKAHSQRTKKNLRRTNSLKTPVFAVPLIIVSTYICFETIGMCLSVYGYLFEFDRFELYRKTALVLFCMSYLSDAFAYIFIQPVIRDTIKTHYRTVKSKVIRSSAKSTTRSQTGIDNLACVSNANTIGRTANQIEVYLYQNVPTDHKISDQTKTQQCILDSNNNKPREQEIERAPTDHAMHSTCNNTHSSIYPTLDAFSTGPQIVGINNLGSSTNSLENSSCVTCKSPYLNQTRIASTIQSSTSNCTTPAMGIKRSDKNENFHVNKHQSISNLDDNHLCESRMALGDCTPKSDSILKIDVRENGQKHKMKLHVDADFD